MALSNRINMRGGSGDGGADVAILTDGVAQNGFNTGIVNTLNGIILTNVTGAIKLSFSTANQNNCGRFTSALKSIANRRYLHIRAMNATGNGISLMQRDEASGITSVEQPFIQYVSNAQYTEQIIDLDGYTNAYLYIFMYGGSDNRNLLVKDMWLSNNP